MPVSNELDATLSALAEGQRVFERYTLGRVLGRGTLGVVWLARDEEKRRNVELKFLPEVLVRDIVAISDLRTEVERVRALQHDAFQAIHSFHEGEGRAAVSSEFVPGNTLGGLCEVRLNGCFDAAELLPWVEPLAEAFTQAHEQLRIAHRALHPGHLVLTPAGRVKVLDFGIAHTLTEAAARHAGGTGRSAALAFSSPQLTAGALPIPADDIFALGATLYDLLAGTPPEFDKTSVRLSIAERRAALNRWGAPIPPAWEAVIAACLAHDPAQRPASVAALVNALRDGFVAGRAAESSVLKLEPVVEKPENPPATANAPLPQPAPDVETPKAPAEPPADLPRASAIKGLAKVTPPPVVTAAPIATTLPEVEAANAIKVQRAHHRGALVALVCIALAVWIARMIADRVLPPVLPDSPTAPRTRNTAAIQADLPVAPTATPAPVPPLIAATDVVPAAPPAPLEQPQNTPEVPTPEVPDPAPEMPAPEPSPPPPPAAPPPAKTEGPIPAIPVPAIPIPAPAVPAPAPATPIPATPEAPPPETPAPKPATPPPAAPMPAVPEPATPAPTTSVPTATAPPSTAPAPATPMPGPRRVEPVPSAEPPKPGEPWTNSLGMPFVPVPKLPVLVAIWETRSRDFEAFAKSIALHWKPAKDGPDHPATDVSFLDGMLFCEWLTTNEEMAGRLKPGQHYRLPTDAEWSALTGLPAERVEALRERDDASDKSFPWGNAWPPPPSAGNFRGLNPTNAGGIGGAKGDIFEQTAPVGSFPPNRQGLFDIAGNVAEMVSDFIAPELGLHATRGGSYLDGDRRVLRTRARGVGEDDHGHTPYIGFRVVLDPRTTE